MNAQTIARSWQDLDVQKWLGREAPRYTSYPSAHHFEALAPEVYAGWLSQLSPDRSVGLYLHVPFCAQMCWFCGCNTQITLRDEPIEAYVTNLEREIKQMAASFAFRPKVHSIHFGGGSPGLVKSNAMQHLFSVLHDHFDIQTAAEISIELDPRRVTIEQAETYVALGFNRVSLGVQDTQHQVQEAINRIQSMALIQQAFDTLRGAGLTALGIDLVYGLPHQTVESLEATLNDVARLHPDRISAFSYAHVPWHKKHQRLIDETSLPSIEAKAHQYLQVDAFLQRIGYVPIGIDHFALPGDGLTKAQAEGTLRRNFMGYTDLPNDNLIGLGASSISQLDGGMAQNIPQATSYETRVATGGPPTVRGWAYRSDDHMRAEVISKLMCFFRVDLAEVLTRHGLELDYFDDELRDLADFVEAGLVSVSDRVVDFHSPLKMLVRSVACVFDRYTREASGGNRYSRVA